MRPPRGVLSGAGERSVDVDTGRARSRRTAATRPRRGFVCVRRERSAMGGIRPEDVCGRPAFGVQPHALADPAPDGRRRGGVVVGVWWPRSTWFAPVAATARRGRRVGTPAGLPPAAGARVSRPAGRPRAAPLSRPQHGTRYRWSSRRRLQGSPAVRRDHAGTVHLDHARPGEAVSAAPPAAGRAGTGRGSDVAAPARDLRTPVGR